MSEENPKDRYGRAKVPLTLFPITAVVYGALAQRDGAKKYGPYNWRGKPIRYSTFIDACQRHILAHIDGEEVAEDSGVPHLAHALACLAIIIDAKESGNLIDDRPPAAKAVARLLKQNELHVVTVPTKIRISAEDLRAISRGGAPRRRPVGIRVRSTDKTSGSIRTRRGTESRSKKGRR
jgi:hypothetical protein